MPDGAVPHERGSVAYRDFGGDGPTVMLLHGLGGNLAHWEPLASLLQDRYRLLAIDLPSHGASTAPSAYSFAADVSAVDGVRRHLGLDRPAVVGHSYGGMLAVALAAVHPGAFRVAVNIDGMGFALGSEARPEVHNEQLPVWSGVTAGDDTWLEAEIEREVEEAAEVGLRLDPGGEMVRRAFQLRSDGLWHGSPTTSRFVEILRALEALRLLPLYAATSCRTVTVVAEHRTPRTTKRQPVSASTSDAFRQPCARPATSWTASLRVTTRTSRCLTSSPIGSSDGSAAERNLVQESTRAGAVPTAPRRRAWRWQLTRAARDTSDIRPDLP
jgi:pimeloyl-ACP methyl ester carboxylesterase